MSKFSFGPTNAADTASQTPSHENSSPPFNGLGFGSRPSSFDAFSFGFSTSSTSNGQPPSRRNEFTTNALSLTAMTTNASPSAAAQTGSRPLAAFPTSPTSNGQSPSWRIESTTNALTLTAAITTTSPSGAAQTGSRPLSCKSALQTSIPSKAQPPPRRASKKFGMSEGDVTFVSLDTVVFNIQRKFLEANTGGFPPIEFDTRGQEVPLVETSETLELLFQFVYPQRSPDTETIPFETLSALAEAAEKYEVFRLMEICKIRMKQTLPLRALEIFIYAYKYNYKDILLAAAPLLLDTPLDQAAKVLPPQLLTHWVRFWHNWSEGARDVVANLPLRVECDMHSHDQTLRHAAWFKLGHKRSREAIIKVYQDLRCPCNKPVSTLESIVSNINRGLATIPTFEAFYKR